MTLVFACGHRQGAPDHAETPPVCLQCGQTAVVAIEGATPRITGIAESPLKVDHGAVS